MSLDRRTSEWTLWVVAASCALHVAEEYLTGWPAWAREVLGVAVPSGIFLVSNAVWTGFAFATARLGWREPAVSLVPASLTLVNAVVFHILPTILQQRRSPGVVTATLLYLPFSSWALLGAWRDGVSRSSIAKAFAVGACLMFAVVLAAGALGSR